MRIHCTDIGRTGHVLYCTAFDYRIIMSHNANLPLFDPSCKMSKTALVNTALALLVAIIAVIGFKLSPLLRPEADLALPATSCNPSQSPCVATLPGGARLEFRISPNPVRPLQKQALFVTINGLPTEQIEIDFDGTAMRMGYNRPRLIGSGAHFQGETILPVCITGSMEWAATILVTTGKRRIAIPFHFYVAPR